MGKARKSCVSKANCYTTSSTTTEKVAVPPMLSELLGKMELFYTEAATGVDAVFVDFLTIEDLQEKVCKMLPGVTYVEESFYASLTKTDVVGTLFEFGSASGPRKDSIRAGVKNATRTMG